LTGNKPHQDRHVEKKMSKPANTTTDEKSYAEEHPEQDPAEGSSEIIDHDLEQSGAQAAPSKKGGGERSGRP
jgi:hypothetical protein